MCDEELLTQADIWPAGYDVGVRNAHVKPGDVVAVVGAGPVGLSAIVADEPLSPRVIIVIDLDDGRLARAQEYGAEMTDNLGVDLAIEVVGVAAFFDLATTLVRARGRVANIGVHGAPVTLHI